MIEASTCEQGKKERLIDATISGCRYPKMKALSWVQKVNRLPEPLQCEDIPKEDFSYFWKANPQPTRSIEEKHNPKSSGKDASQGPSFLNPDTARRILGSNISRIRYCYESQRLYYPKLSGKVVTQFKVEPSGKVVDATVIYTTLNHYEVEHCILLATQALRFPERKSGNTATITYPYIFRSGP